jgi:ribosomal protein L37AE/L43A
MGARMTAVVIKLPFKPTCGHCGSDRVFREGWIGYNPATSEWDQIETVWHDMFRCAECGEIDEDDIRWTPAGAA